MNRIAIHSVPRSGSTWLGSLVDSHPSVIYKYQPLFSYRFKGALTSQSSKSDISNFFSEIAQVSDDFLDQVDSKLKGIVPRFFKSEPTCIVYKEVRYHHILANMLKHDSEVKVVGLIRNPLSVLYSWWQAPREFRRDLGWNFEEEWKKAPSKNQGRPEEFYGFEKWKEVAGLFHSLHAQYPDRVYILRYLDLLQSTDYEVERLLSFMGLNVSKQTNDFIVASRQRNDADVYAVYKNKVSDIDWVDKLPGSIVDAVTKDLEGTAFEVYL